MDNFCIERGTLLDNPSVRTLENPEKHSMHCLLDVPSCVLSRYALLAEPATPGGLYSVKYQLGAEGTKMAQDEGEKQRGLGKLSGLKMTFTGVDDGTDTLKCLSQTGKVEASTSDGGSKDIKSPRVAHGALMIIAWLFMVPLGIGIARFFKHLGHRWYLLHVGIQISAIIVMIISLIAVFLTTYPKTSFDSPGIVMIHAVIGVIVSVMGILVQPILGYLSNKYYNPHRKGAPAYPDKIHWWAGRLTYLLAIANIFIGIDVFGEKAMVWYIVVVALLGFAFASFASFEISKPKSA